MLLFFLAALWQAAPAVPHTAIKAEHYDALKDVLIQGDLVYAFAIRDPVRGERPEDAQGGSWKTRPMPKTVWNEEKYAKRVAALNAIKDSRIEKQIVLSSVEDLKANLARFPKDLGSVAYNSEPGMTPGEELLNMESAVIEFAKIAHAAGLKVHWGPTNFMLAEDEAKFLGLAKYVDEMALQHQRTLQNEGVDAFVALTRKRAEMIRKINPKCHVAVQVVIGRGSKEDQIKALRLVAPYAGTEGIWTMQDTATALEMLKALRSRGAGIPAC